MKLCASFRLLGLAAAILLAAGCETPRTRANLHPGAFAKLSGTDQRLVLAGKVRDGMMEDAVYIAWGEPDVKGATASGKESGESWFYYRQITVQTPLGSFDRWSVGASLLAPAAPLAENPTFGVGGVGNEGALFYQPHLQTMDAMDKEADFRNGRLVRHRIDWPTRRR